MGPLVSLTAIGFVRRLPGALYPNSYATQHTAHERVAAAQPTTRAAAGSGRWQQGQTRPGHLAAHAVEADLASRCALSARTASQSSCALSATARSPRNWRANGQHPGRAHGCRAGSCAMGLSDSTLV